MLAGTPCMHVTFDLNATEPVDWLKVSHIHIYGTLSYATFNRSTELQWDIFYLYMIYASEEVMVSFLSSWVVENASTETGVGTLSLWPIYSIRPFSPALLLHYLHAPIALSFWFL